MCNKLRIYSSNYLSIYLQSIAGNVQENMYISYATYYKYRLRHYFFFYFSDETSINAAYKSNQIYYTIFFCHYIVSILCLYIHVNISTTRMNIKVAINI